MSSLMTSQHNNHSFSPRRQWFWPSPLLEIFRIFPSQADWVRMVPFHGRLLVSGSKWWTHVSAPVNNPGYDGLSPLTSKHTRYFEEMAFLWGLCSTVTLQENHLDHRFKYQRSRMMWLILPLKTHNICSYSPTQLSIMSLIKSTHLATGIDHTWSSSGHIYTKMKEVHGLRCKCRS